MASFPLPLPPAPNGVPVAKLAGDPENIVLVDKEPRIRWLARHPGEQRTARAPDDVVAVVRSPDDVVAEAEQRGRAPNDVIERVRGTPDDVVAQVSGAPDDVVAAVGVTAIRAPDDVVIAEGRAPDDVVVVARGAPDDVVVEQRGTPGHLAARGARERAPLRRRLPRVVGGTHDAARQAVVAPVDRLAPLLRGGNRRTSRGRRVVLREAHGAERVQEASALFERAVSLAELGCVLKDGLHHV